MRWRRRSADARPAPAPYRCNCPVPRHGGHGWGDREGELIIREEGGELKITCHAGCLRAQSVGTSERSPRGTGFQFRRGRGHEQQLSRAGPAGRALFVISADGHRNDQVNKSAFSLGQLCTPEGLDKNEVEHLLRKAAEENGYVEKDGLRAVLGTSAAVSKRG